MKKILLISTGGHMTPIIHSIHKHNPDGIIFFTSKTALKAIQEKILQKVTIKAHEIIITPDHQSLGKCIDSLYTHVPERLTRLAGNSIKWPQYIDYTGGTKSMSAALVWASIRHTCIFSYVGSQTPDGRHKQGLGTVIDGREHIQLSENPWNALLSHTLLESFEQFNTGHYQQAKITLQHQLHTIDQTHHPLINWLKDISQALASWQNHHYAQAKTQFEKLLHTTPPLNQPQIPGDLNHLHTELKNLQPLLTKLALQLPSREQAWDLVSSAVRKYQLEQATYDALQRLLAAYQTLIKLELEHHFTTLPYLPVDELPQHYLAQHAPQLWISKIQNQLFCQPHIGQQIDILATLKNPLGLALNSQKNLKKTLFLASTLVITTSSTTLDHHYHQLLNGILQTLKATPEQLTIFPSIPF